MPDSDKDLLPDPTFATAAGKRRDALRRGNLLGGDAAASRAFDLGAERPSEPFQTGDIADPFKVRGT